MLVVVVNDGACERGKTTEQEGRERSMNVKPFNGVKAQTKNHVAETLPILGMPQDSSRAGHGLPNLHFFHRAHIGVYRRIFWGHGGEEVESLQQLPVFV